VRQLENVMQRAVILCKGERYGIKAEDDKGQK